MKDLEFLIKGNNTKKNREALGVIKKSMYIFKVFCDELGYSDLQIVAFAMSGMINELEKMTEDYLKEAKKRGGLDA